MAQLNGTLWEKDFCRVNNPAERTLLPAVAPSDDKDDAGRFATKVRKLLLAYRDKCLFGRKVTGCFDGPAARRVFQGLAPERDRKLEPFPRWPIRLAAP